MRVLFIGKRGAAYGDQYCLGPSGLYNSTRYIVDALVRNGINAKLVEVIDNNDIDFEVTQFNPNVVIIEALWVVPDKFDELFKLHPTVHWCVHIHSNIPFLANEGIAMDWIRGYDRREIEILANCKNAQRALSLIAQDPVYLPNVYEFGEPFKKISGSILNVACLGAIRPMKNQLIQAMAAVAFADSIGMALNFHVNSSRVETGGKEVLKNLRGFFADGNHHQLVEHDWMDKNQLRVLMTFVDIGMQVSMSETFNIMTADYVANSVPIVVSKEIEWASSWNQADDDSIDSIIKIMRRVYRNGLLCRWNKCLLRSYSRESERKWVEFLR